MQASVGSSAESLVTAVGDFLESLGAVRWGPLGLALLLFLVYLSLRARALFHILRAAYPGTPIPFRRVWGAYVAAYGFNNVIPARGGDVVKLFLTRGSVPTATYPAVAAAFVVELGFDAVMGVAILTFAFSQGVFPRPPELPRLPSLDLQVLQAHPKLALVLLASLALAAVVAFVVLSGRVRAFWARVGQGLAILADRKRYLREVFLVQLVGWGFRFAAFWLLLEAFGVGGSVRNVLLVLGVAAVSALVPFTPGGAGVQQALLVTVFAGAAPGATVAAYSVGQQVAVATLTLGVGFLALVGIFRIRSFREVLRLGRAERMADRGGVGARAASAGPGAPRAPG
ncbi:MAG: flippase-like domain-containing protein [Actinomycetota bacterium]|nr:flippase-like domain-containing protein [Actinomycetota bacterium]